MRVLKKEMNPVNRIVAGVFIALGWMMSYGAMYYLAYNNGYHSGSSTIINQMYTSCRTETNLKFYNDESKYLCMKVGEM